MRACVRVCVCVCVCMCVCVIEISLNPIGPTHAISQWTLLVATLFSKCVHLNSWKIRKLSLYWIGANHVELLDLQACSQCFSLDQFIRHTLRRLI